MISQGIDTALTHQQTTRNPAYKGDFAPEEESGFASGIVGPGNYCSKVSHCLIDNISCLEIKGGLLSDCTR
jgi:hypothetical protein